MDMGFPPNACQKALFFTENSGLEAATQWVMEHITDPDFSDPLVQPGELDFRSYETEASSSEDDFFLVAGTDTKQSFVADPAGLEMIVAMGFTTQQATKALKETNNNIERAADWIFSHATEVDAMEVSDEAGGATGSSQYRDGNSSKLSGNRSGTTFTFFQLSRIQIGGIHFTHGNVVSGRSLCLPHFEERQVGNIQRQQGGHFAESAERTGIFVFI